jgi:hypothetical protein
MKNTSMLALLLGFQFGGLHFFATKLSLYWEIVWFDNLMHFFGGVVLVFLLWALTDVRIFSKTYVQSPLKMSLLVLCILLGWEVLGVFLIGYFKSNFIADTSLDILFGILGAVIGWCFAWSLIRLEK